MKNRTKYKRFSAFVLVLVMLVMSFSGCSKKHEEVTHELNIIDDNYRNYYEIFIYSFYDSDGDGIGDLNGVTTQLDYIEELGCNGIWLMPVMPSTTYHKYDVTDYKNIDSEYGTLDDFRRLVNACHKKNINVIIDIVFNHTSSKHPWFVEATEYLSSLEPGEEPDLTVCPYVDYYKFSKKQETKDYYRVGASDWYYEGVFWSEMPDLNLSSEKVIKELKDISAFWIDLGVDGFRMDAAIHYEEGDTDFNNNVLNDIYSYCKTLNPEFYMVSEVWAALSTIAQYYKSDTPSMFNFDAGGPEGKIIKTAKGQLNAEDFVKTMKQYQETFSAVNSKFIDAPFLTNHDMGRVSNALVSDITKMKMAAGLLMTMNGSPYIYYGEEIGMSSKGKTDENKRVAFIWSKEGKTPGMTNGPAGADKDIVSSFDGAYEQEKDEDSLLSFYKKALRVRNENPELARGSIEIVSELTSGDCAVILKTYEGSTIAVVYNTSQEACTVKLKGSALEGMSVVGNLSTDNSSIYVKKNILYMPAKSICVMK